MSASSANPFVPAPGRPLPANLPGRLRAGEFVPPDPFRPTGDKVEHIQLQWLDAAPFNPKRKIHGRYRRGLWENISTFALRDDLKVWPNPHKPGRYYVLDGNQRLDVLLEMAEDYLVSVEAKAETDRMMAHLGETVEPPSDREVAEYWRAQYQTILADDDRMRAIRQRVNTTEVSCRVLAELDPADAKLFTAAFNRNHATYDEAALTRLADDYLAEKVEALRATLGETLAARREQITRSILRPEEVLAQVGLAPATAPATPATPDAPGGQAVQGQVAFTPTEDEPWGPPPADPDGPVAGSSTAGATAAQGSLVNAGPPREAIRRPLMFSLSAETFDLVTASLIRSKSRIFREQQLRAAVVGFEEQELTEVVKEVVLRVAALARLGGLGSNAAEAEDDDAGDAADE